MAHFAEIDSNNIVTRVLVVPDEQEHRGQDFLANELGLGGTWVQTSYNNRIRFNYAGVGYSYDAARDAFIAPKPECHDTAVFDEATCTWSCPDASHVIIIGEENV
jgi:hypothetical protein